MNPETAYPPGEVLFPRAQIEARIAEMGKQIANDYRDQELITVCVLKGAMYFHSNLLLSIEMDVQQDVIQVSSYGNEMRSSGVVTILKEPRLNLEGKNVLVVEDIIDTGFTIREVCRYIREERHALMVRTAALLDKFSARKVDFVSHYVGFPLHPPRFVIGYGLDAGERFRNVPDIRALD